LALSAEQLPQPVILLDMSEGAGQKVGQAEKHQLIKSAAAFFVQHAVKDRSTAMMKLGSSVGGSCQAPDLIKPFDENDPSEAVELLRWLIPSGKPAIVKAIQGATAVSASQSAVGSIVLLASSGEGCGGDVCAYAKQHAKSFPSVPIHVIGVDVGSEAVRNYNCLSAETKGLFFNIGRFEELEEAVNSITSRLAQPIMVQETAPEEVDPLIALLGVSGGFLRGGGSGQADELLGLEIVRPKSKIQEQQNTEQNTDELSAAHLARRKQFENSIVAKVTAASAFNSNEQVLLSETGDLNRRTPAENIGKQMTEQELQKLASLKAEFAAREDILRQTEVALKARRRLISENSSVRQETVVDSASDADVTKINELVVLGEQVIAQKKRELTDTPKEQIADRAGGIALSRQQQSESEKIADTTDEMSEARIRRTKELRKKTIEKIEKSRAEKQNDSPVQVLVLSETAEVIEGGEILNDSAAPTRLDQVRVLLDKAFSDDRAIKALLGRLAVKEEEDQSFQRPLQRLGQQIDRVGSELPIPELEVVECVNV